MPHPLATLRAALLRLFLNTLGRLSTGIQLCFRDGPTAGTALAYAYKNQPHGRFLIGKIIDRRFLNYVGWQRARQRFAAVLETLQCTITTLQQAHQQIHILDIASGPADCLLHFLQQHPLPPNSTILCRDRDPASLDLGRRHAAAANIHLTFQQADAFDPSAFLTLPHTPTLIFSVGLYELIPDDAAIQSSIRMIHQTLAPAGVFLLVHQSRHSNSQLAANLFPKHTPAPLTLRSASQLSSWLTTAGFEILHTRSCADGWYTLITARKELHATGPL